MDLAVLTLFVGSMVPSSYIYTTHLYIYISMIIGGFWCNGFQYICKKVTSRSVITPT